MVVKVDQENRPRPNHLLISLVVFILALHFFSFDVILDIDLDLSLTI